MLIASTSSLLRVQRPSFPICKDRQLIHSVSQIVMSELDYEGLPVTLCTTLLFLSTWRSESIGGGAAAGSSAAEALSWHSGIAAGTASRRLAESS